MLHVFFFGKRSFRFFKHDFFIVKKRKRFVENDRNWLLSFLKGMKLSYDSFHNTTIL